MFCDMIDQIFEFNKKFVAQKWIHKATFQGYQPAIDYCKEHGHKWY